MPPLRPFPDLASAHGLAAIMLAVGVASAASAQTAARLGPHADAAQPVGFEIYLPLRDAAGLDALLAEQHRPGSTQYRHWLSPAAFAGRFGAAPDTVARVVGELRAAGLTARVSGSHTLHVDGPAATVERAFATRLAIGRFSKGRDRLVAEVVPTLPPALAASGAVIAHFAAVNHMHTHSMPAAAAPLNRNGPTGSYWFDDLKQAYSFPSVSVATGQGVSIGILMAGNYNPADMDGYFGHEGLPTPALSTTQIFGGAPFDASGSAVESELDIQQSGGMAPGAHITLFNIPDLSDASILAGLTSIIEGNATDIVSMSFGAPEITYTAAYNNGANMTGMLAVYDDLFKQGTAQGISFVASSGDGGAMPVPAAGCFAAGATSQCGGFIRSVELPASSPHVTAVGGTNLMTTHGLVSTDLQSVYVSESANFDRLTTDIFYGTPATGGMWGSGGGISTVFPQPAYQTGVSTASSTRRMVPDVALHMGGCPSGAVTPCGPSRSSDVAAINGLYLGLIGTSAAAPAFAGLLALKEQLLGGRVGNENYDLYALAKAQAAGAKPVVFRTGIPGKNGAFQTAPAYNLVLGNGTLHANAFIGVARLPSAGAPQSASNP
jgi:subtilase family serine protease